MSVQHFKHYYHHQLAIDKPYPTNPFRFVLDFVITLVITSPFSLSPNTFYYLDFSITKGSFCADDVQWVTG